MSDNPYACGQIICLESRLPLAKDNELEACASAFRGDVLQSTVVDRDSKDKLLCPKS